MGTIRSVLIILTALIFGFSGAANSKDSNKGSNCTYFGRSFCLGLPNAAEVHFLRGPDFTIHNVDMGKYGLFGIYEGNHPDAEHKKCTFTQSSVLDRDIEMCAYTRNKQVEFLFMAGEEPEMEGLPIYLHVWFPEDIGKEEALNTLKRSLRIP